ncbi:flagellar basal-body rod protein FlgC [Geomonas silvestris]|uniref:Flagellar basal-body rod protein FlgC n=1 Tax=Geomonas silvestris TaxID=2740184 RepID=A0A6V8MF21_9BACT|nr:flagellar basal body rod protein FlgC [Geomonas silvestris]GFO58598.1 flagellar basal-body rod protein FlgC [Geomonas silvestris]
MDFFSSIDISSSALSAERTRINLISSNLANVNSTRSAEGGPYRRKDAIFTATPAEKSSFGAALGKAAAARKVEVSQVREDPNPPRLQYEPTHPDADANGYVAYPNVNVVEEMADMVSATRSYEANVTAAQAAKAMALKTLDLGR